MKPLDTAQPAGFTFIEFIVIISIFAIMSSFVLVNYRTFTRNIETQNLAQDIALMIKRAQNSGISAASEIGSPTTRFGVHFVPANGTLSSIVLYRKAGGPGVSVGYDPQTAVTLDTITIGVPGAAVGICELTQSTCATWLATPADIEFERPNPEPLVSGADQPFTISVINRANQTPWFVKVGRAGNIYVTR